MKTTHLVDTCGGGVLIHRNEGALCTSTFGDMGNTVLDFRSAAGKPSLGVVRNNNRANVMVASQVAILAQEIHVIACEDGRMTLAVWLAKRNRLIRPRRDESDMSM
jgi:hypothetical protein